MIGRLGPEIGGNAARILPGQSVLIVLAVLATGGTAEFNAEVANDDGTTDLLVAPPQSLSSITTGLSTNYYFVTQPASKPGWVVGLYGYGSSSPSNVAGALYARGFIGSLQGAIGPAQIRKALFSGYFSPFNAPIDIGTFQPPDFSATWLFQGTVAEDATGGTHVCTLTVTPGVGNVLEVAGGYIGCGATATAQTAVAYTTDGTNTIAYLANAEQHADTTTSAVVPIPQGQGYDIGTIGGAGAAPTMAYQPLRVSGTMQLVLKVSTTAVSVTQTFALECRIRASSLPTAVLADAVGTPTLVTNTNALF